jgi:hypothetical protein
LRAKQTALVDHGFSNPALMCARPMVAIYRRTVAGFLPAETSCSMNAPIVAGGAGK